SRHTLELQGGPMNEAEVAEFRRNPFYRQAVQVRLWDEGGKDPDMATPPFRHYVPALQRVVDTYAAGYKA
ncbi:MAG TPA: phosphodiesterase, partial [Nordella sp.]|nr:phosphodiesterase [Nordella sp.]